MAPDITESIVITQTPKANGTTTTKVTAQTEYNVKQRHNNLTNDSSQDNNKSINSNNNNNTKNSIRTNDPLISLRRNHDFIADIRWPDLIAQLFIHGGALYGLYLLFFVKFLTIVWCKYNNLIILFIQNIH